MAMDSKSLPLIAGLVVLVAAGAFMLFKSTGTRPEAPTNAPPAPEIKLHPKQVEARAAIHEGRLDDAGELLREVPPEDPAYLSALGDLGILYEQTGNAEGALNAANAILARDSDDSNAHFIACRAKQMLGEYDVAEFACMRAIEIAPRNVLARYSVAFVRVAEGKTDEAINSYLRAMEIDRSEPRLLDALGDLTRLEQARPDFSEVHYALAFFANVLDNPTQERAELERYLELNQVGPIAEMARRKLQDLGD
jgi:tetratricopeptide (TPR) repeat protein